MTCPLDCHSARELFSEHQDRRLDPSRRSLLLLHLEDCQDCRGRWHVYARVFDAVAEIREVPAARPFVRPAEPPGAGTGPRRVVADRWSRYRVAAAAAVILGVTHVAVFEWARGGAGTAPIREFAPLVEAPAPAMAAIDAGLFSQDLRDHVEATEVVTREIAHMPPDAGEEARSLVKAHIDLLRADHLTDRAERSTAVLGNRAPVCQDYLHAWNGFCADVTGGLDRLPSTAVVGWLQDRLDRSVLADRIVHARNALAREPLGRSWRDSDRQKALVRVSTADDLPEDVGLFLGGNTELFRAEYASARNAFQSLRSARSASRLAPLAQYMEAECLRRVGRYDQAMMLVAGGNVMRMRCFTVVKNDPFAVQFQIFRNMPLQVLGVTIESRGESGVRVVAPEPVFEFVGDLQWAGGQDAPARQPGTPAADGSAPAAPRGGRRD